MSKFEHLIFNESNTFPISDYEGGRKWSGGLMPLSSAGCYGRPPVSSTSFLLKSTVHPSTSSSQSSQGGYKSKKLKTYSAYSVSKYYLYIIYINKLFNSRRTFKFYKTLVLTLDQFVFSLVIMIFYFLEIVQYMDQPWRDLMIGHPWVEEIV